MNNPFRKRATEFLRDDEAFLAVVSPEPVSYFLGEYGRSGELYDRLVMIRGTPGSGKTTLARLFEFPALNALLRNTSSDTYRPLVAALTEVRAISDGKPRLVACRLPLETDYREFWEFPYPDELKIGLMTGFVQARAVLAWIRNLTAAGVSLGGIHIEPRPDAQAAVAAIGGVDGAAVLKRARAVESSLYSVVSALVAPAVSDLPPDATSAYRPFDVIDRLRVTIGPAGAEQALDLLPLVVLDDAHTLHPAQFQAMRRWLVRRELRVARWVLTRLDVLHPGEALAAVVEDRSEAVEMPGIAASRETTEILLQSGAQDRRAHRLTFRKMAKDMATRYLALMTLFRDRRLTRLDDLLGTEPEPLAPSKKQELQKSVDAARRDLRITDDRYESLRATVSAYRPAGGRAPGEDVQLAMLKILLHRYVKRTSDQRGLFEAGADPEPSRPITANVDVWDAARVHLLHRFDRPFYYTIDDLCDASSENAEQFLRLAATLVDQSAAQVVRQKPASLPCRLQNKLLREAAGEILGAWSFPQYQLVSRLAGRMAERCLKVTLEPNAPLGAGANAYGVPQTQFDELPERHPDLARVLQFGIAYNAFTIVPRYDCKGKEWCLIELGGILILRHGLTLKRGGFIESTADEMAEMVAEGTA